MEKTNLCLHTNLEVKEVQFSLVLSFFAYAGLKGNSVYLCVYFVMPNRILFTNSRRHYCKNCNV